MERDINLDEISDGKLYDANDMVKVGCSDCAGCSACCHGMGETIVLDPYDIWQLTSHLDVPLSSCFHQAGLPFMYTKA